MGSIENYISNYKESCPLKMFNNVSYKSTNDMISAADLAGVKEPTFIKESPRKYVFLFGPIFLLAAFFTYHSISKSIMNILPLVIVLIIAIFLIREAHIKKNENDTVVDADEEKFIIEKQTFQWKDIANAYIITDNAGRTPDKFLLLELKGGNINKIYINQVGVSGKRLAAIIEHYKN